MISKREPMRHTMTSRIRLVEDYHAASQLFHSARSSSTRCHRILFNFMPSQAPSALLAILSNRAEIRLGFVSTSPPPTSFKSALINCHMTSFEHVHLINYCFDYLAHLSATLLIILLSNSRRSKSGQEPLTPASRISQARLGDKIKDPGLSSLTKPKLM